MADVDLDDVRIAFEREVPDVVENLGFRDDFTGPAHEELEHRELACRQRHFDIAARASMLDRIDLEVASCVDDGLRPARTAKQRAEARQEHDERERLGEVVVSAGVQRLGLVVFTVFRGEHQYRRPVACFAQVLAHLEAVHARQHDVENDHVVTVLGGHPETIGTRQGNVDGEAFGFEPAAHRRRHLLLVFDDEHTHDQRSVLFGDGTTSRDHSERQLNWC